MSKIKPVTFLLCAIAIAILVGLVCGYRYLNRPTDQQKKSASVAKVKALEVATEACKKQGMASNTCSNLEVSEPTTIEIKGMGEWIVYVNSADDKFAYWVEVDFSNGKVLDSGHSR